MLTSLVFNGISFITKPVEVGVRPVINELRYGPHTGKIEIAFLQIVLLAAKASILGVFTASSPA